MRQINEFLDFDAILQHLKPFYSHTGRSSIDPELMIRMLLIRYCYGIRSERRLFEEVELNLAYRCFYQLGLEDAVPNHSSFFKNRYGLFRDADLLRMVFDTVVKRCIEEELVKGEGFAIDASAYRRLLKAQGLIGSMSRKGNCWDNAVAESFFGSLKRERVLWTHYQTRRKAQQDVMNYISMFYNSHRLHSYLG